MLLLTELRYSGLSTAQENGLKINKKSNFPLLQNGNGRRWTFLSAVKIWLATWTQLILNFTSEYCRTQAGGFTVINIQGIHQHMKSFAFLYTFLQQFVHFFSEICSRPTHPFQISPWCSMKTGVLVPNAFDYTLFIFSLFSLHGSTV